MPSGVAWDETAVVQAAVSTTDFQAQFYMASWALSCHAFIASGLQISCIKTRSILLVMAAVAAQ